MRIIDEKGRLFGLINVADLLVVMFILAICSSFLISYCINQREGIHNHWFGRKDLIPQVIMTREEHVKIKNELMRKPTLKAYQNLEQEIVELRIEIGSVRHKLRLKQQQIEKCVAEHKKIGRRFFQ